jgi:antitoxin component YwqK of YwqJK toxin-antitoxin module
MKNNITLSIVTIALAICTNTNGVAQTIDLIDSKAVIEKGIKLHEDEKYDEAVIEYKKITDNDTNYVLASYELIITYMAQKKDSIALLLCDEILPLRSSYTPGLIATKANLLDNLKRSDEALKTYEEGQKRYPLNYSYYYESGVLKMRQKKYFEAYSWFEKSVKINPYHANTHYQMGLIALKQGKLIPCMLAWQYYLILDNSTDRAKQLINTLEAMSKNEYDMGEAEQIKEMDNFTDYSELEALVKSKVALSSKYKSETKLKFDLTKQLQLILEKIETSPSDKGFYAEFYAPFYKKIYANKMLDAFTYDILNGLNNEDVNSWMKKNKEKYNAFANFVANYVIENKTTYEEDLNGQKIKAQHYFNSNYKITSVGNVNSENKNIGYWKYYYPSAIVKAEGPYNNTQQKDGVWKYYDNGGAITSLERVSNNKYEGSLETYYFNGAKSTTLNYKADVLEGEQTKYYSTGAKNTVYNYTNNKENGQRSQYYKNGKLEYEVNIVDGKFEGPCTTYHENGNIKSKSSYVNDNRVGVHTTFYDYPKDAKKEISNYDNGVIKGHYEEYHWNGALAEIGEVSNDGMRTGLWKTYNDKKAITSEINYKNGKLDGSSIYYSNKGVKWDEYIYSNDMLQEYKATSVRNLI